MRKVNYPITSFEMRNFHLTHKSTEVRIHRNSAHFISAVVRCTRFFLYKQPVYKQPGLRFFENNNRIQWSIVMLNNGEQ